MINLLLQADTDDVKLQFILLYGCKYQNQQPPNEHFATDTSTKITTHPWPSTTVLHARYATAATKELVATIIYTENKILLSTASSQYP